MKQPEIWAHRGASGYAPENTMPAFLLALEMGADGIELDVQMTKDKRLVVIHDERIDRTSDGTGFVRDYTLDELRKFNFNKNFPKYGQVDIPVLEDVLDLIRKSDLMLNIELKNGIYEYLGLEEYVAAAVKLKEVEKQVIYSSFNHYSVKKMGELAPDVPRGILYSDRWIDVPGYGKKMNVQALHPALYHLADGSLVPAAHEQGLLVHVWTVNEAVYAKQCAEQGVDAIITNYPDMVREAIS